MHKLLFIFWCRLLLETPNPYPYWIVSIASPFTFIATTFHLFADKMKLPYAPAVSHIAGAIVSALNLHQMVAIVLVNTGQLKPGTSE